MRSSAGIWAPVMAAIVVVLSGTALADPIDLVTVVDTTLPYQAGNYVLVDVTVGNYTVGPGTQNGTYLATGTTTAAGYYPANPPEEADDFNLNTFCQRGSHTPDWMRTVGFNGQQFWSDVNGSDVDFFVFETNANDTIKVKPILPDGSGGEVLGLPITFTSGLSPAGAWGDTTLNIVAHPTENSNQHGGQHIVGLAFEVTDLLDSSGNSLTRDALLLGLQIESPGLDPACIAAVVIPEPSTLALLGLGMLARLSLSRRRRR